MEAIAENDIKTNVNIQHKERIEWVDVCKGFAMILVMLGHTSFPEPIKSWLYTFHMPLFFFLSGYVFSVRKYSNIKEFLSAKIRTLIFPMLMLGVIMHIWNYAVNPDIGIGKAALNIVIGSALQLRGSTYDSGLWFITALFFAEIIMYSVIKVSKNNCKTILITAFSCSIFGYLYVHIINHICPWALEASLIAVGFVALGYVLRNFASGIFEKLTQLKYSIIYLVLSILVTYINIKFNWKVDIYTNKLGFYPIFYIGAASGALLSISILKSIKNSTVLKYIGINSFVYYAFHCSVYSTVDKISGLNKIGILECSTVKGVVYVVLAAAVIAIIAYIINNYMPWILGKKTKHRQHGKELK